MNKTWGWDFPPQDLLQNYVEKCKLFATDDKAFATFRQDKDYTKVLEGGGYSSGRIYYDKIVRAGMLPKLLTNLHKFRENDVYGSPSLFNYGDLRQINHNTMMYIYHTLDMKRLIDSHQPKKVVEIGGGYGGMCKTFSCMHSFDEYILIDLPPVLELCKKYLSKFPELYSKVTFIDPGELQRYSAIENIDLSIAVFSLSECNEETQNMYADKILDNSKYVFLGYNRLHIPEVNKIFSNLMSGLDKKFNVEFDKSVMDCLYIYLTKKEKE